ncbi:hypothetical protein V495_01251 [Pseudogymnoascus sp. VKM F-4514 (FW-929)]|nr:hypothetical protein V495_01251 [Pseudogymnoascus sp. VKM F-4514 (FW-929)]KFY62285.1 hypothetical protein V497_02494 [Pseudogymnoascus sp. VKM F-4516 (FW-969)]
MAETPITRPFKAYSSELELVLQAAGITRNPRGRHVWVAAPDVAVPFWQLAQLTSFSRDATINRQDHGPGYRNPWDMPPAPLCPPGLPSPVAANAQLFTMIPEAEQFWPAEYREFDRRYAGRLLSSPTITMTSAGGPIRRPSPPVATYFGSEDEIARSIRAHVAMESYFLSDTWRGDDDRFELSCSEGSEAGEPVPGSAPAVPPTPHAISKSTLSAAAPVFIPRAAAPQFVPGLATTQSPVHTVGLLPVASQLTPASAVQGMGLHATVEKVQGTGGLAALDTVSVLGANQDDLRMVLLEGIPRETTLQQISTSVSSGLYGALYSINFRVEGEKRVAVVIFRDAATDGGEHSRPGAAGYFAALMSTAAKPSKERDGALWPFPQDCTPTIRLEPFPANDIIKGMRLTPETRPSAPHSVEPGKGDSRPMSLSRRITLVGQSALFNKFNEREMKKVIFRGGAVTLSVVDRICVYNGGNATMIFADVETASDSIQTVVKVQGQIEGLIGARHLLFQRPV